MHIYIYIYILYNIYNIYINLYTFYPSIYNIQKGDIKNWAIQFLKNEIKTVLVLQNKFYLLWMKVSTAE